MSVDVTQLSRDELEEALVASARVNRELDARNHFLGNQVRELKVQLQSLEDVAMVVHTHVLAINKALEGPKES